VGGGILLKTFADLSVNPVAYGQRWWWWGKNMWVGLPR